MNRRLAMPAAPFAAAHARGGSTLPFGASKARDCAGGEPEAGPPPTGGLP